MTQFNYSAAAELFPGKNIHRPQTSRYRRFSSAAEAVRYVIEDMPTELVRSSILEVEEQRFDGAQIRGLYDAEAFPLARMALA
ncbi:hypothetical protein [Devosia nitrariae]|uniref:Uncharacterized protein n=1 Tax=Devosia nitrariae TaxID=2071872 RepID=A0ABQ5VZE9_9HYPH|nr:hypothetical protein [Devosia nitrariae]GLQ53158.1 hypothetical protein GCM10010862_04160 [Devosia nitrariae]